MAASRQLFGEFHLVIVHQSVVDHNHESHTGPAHLQARAGTGVAYHETSVSDVLLQIIGEWEMLEVQSAVRSWHNNSNTSLENDSTITELEDGILDIGTVEYGDELVKTCRSNGDKYGTVTISVPYISFLGIGCAYRAGR